MPGTTKKTISPCLQFVQRVTKAFLEAGGHDATCYPSLRINHAIPGHVTGEIQIGKHNLNRLGSLHGGLICSLVDTMGSLALASKGLYSTGVSTDIHSTFVKAAGGVGDIVKLDGKVINMGKVMATTRIELRHPVTDLILAYGSHSKFIGKAVSHAENVVFDETGDYVVKGKAASEWPES